MNRRQFLKLAGATGLAAAGGGPRGLAANLVRYRPTAREPNVVVVLVDQLRKEAFDAWMPGVGRLARNGVAFQRMRSAAPWTYPSVISLMSGFYPQQHGAIAEMNGSRVMRFSEDVPLLQKILHDRGYRTAAFVTNPFLKQWNPFYLGFDVFQANFVRDTGARRADPSEWNTLRMFSPSVNEAVFQHLDSAPPRGPEFTYVHYIDVHGPWDGAPFLDTYESAVRFTDGSILSLHRRFMERYDGNLYFLVTSDHGCRQGDDCDVGEGPQWRVDKQSVHEFNVRIPAALLPSRLVTSNETSDAPCSNVDVVPTLLDLLGIRTGLDFPGSSLKPVFPGLTSASAVASRTRWRRALPVYSRISAFGSSSDCIVVRNRKYMRYLDAGTREVTARRVFDLTADPREVAPIGNSLGTRERLLARIAGLDSPFGAGAELRLPEDVRAEIRSLGYLVP